MIEQLEDMPDGTIGFRAVGTVEPHDYKNVLVPAIEAAAEAGEVRLVYVIGEEFDSYSLGAMVQDTKLGVTHSPKIWKRVAVVTNHDWIKHSVALFVPLLPGEIQAFSLGELDQAKEWAAA